VKRGGQGWSRGGKEKNGGGEKGGKGRKRSLVPGGAQKGDQEKGQRFEEKNKGTDGGQSWRLHGLVVLEAENCDRHVAEGG